MVAVLGLQAFPERATAFQTQTGTETAPGSKALRASERSLNAALRLSGTATIASTSLADSRSRARDLMVESSPCTVLAIEAVLRRRLPSSPVELRDVPAHLAEVRVLEIQ